VVNSTDSVILKRHIIKFSEITDPVKLKAADLNGDGNINSSDVSLMKRYLLRIIDKFR